MEDISIKVLIAYDQGLVAYGLEALLTKHKDINVVAIFENGDELHSKIAGLTADILIIELTNWIFRHFEYVKLIHNRFPNLKLLILSELISHNQLENLMPHIHGYVLRTCSSEKVFTAIHEIFSSGKYLCSKAIDVFFGDEKKHDHELDLTVREKEILTGWLTTKDNYELANQLNISQSTVRSHLKNIRQKLGNLNHSQLMNFTCRENIIKGKFKPLCCNCKAYQNC
ncbi:MAG: response regulator transcription factor [Prolixibacteraceae bacterium]